MGDEPFIDQSPLEPSGQPASQQEVAELIVGGAFGPGTADLLPEGQRPTSENYLAAAQSVPENTTDAIMRLVGHGLVDRDAAWALLAELADEAGD